MRGSIAFLLAAVLGLAVGTDAARSFGAAAAGDAGLIAQAGSIDRVDVPPLAYIASTGSAYGLVVVELDTNRRSPGSTRTDRFPDRLDAPAAPVTHAVPSRIATIDRSVLGFGHTLAAARTGRSFFATTTPPPFRT